MKRALFLAVLAVLFAPAAQAAAPARPNILVIMADDLGFSDLGAFGSEIATPNLDAIAREGRLMTSMYATPMPHTSHAEFLFGVDHHLTVDRFSAPGRTAAATTLDTAPGAKPVPLPAALKAAGYHTYMIGTWDTGTTPEAAPQGRGFERSHALMSMAGDYYPPDGANVPLERENFRYLEDGRPVPWPAGYITDVWTDRLIAWLGADRADGRPFFAYAAYTSPHFPLQAPDDAIARQKGRYDGGYDAVRAARLARQRRLGLFAKPFPAARPSASPRYPRWDQLPPEQRAVEARRMEVYAAMVENLDWNVGRLVAALKRDGRYANTLIVVTSNNGAAQSVETHRDPKGMDNRLANMGRRNSWIAYTERWAEVSNAPFSGWKAKGTEGGVAVPTIVRLPGGRGGRPIEAMARLKDLPPTLLAAAGAAAPRAPALAYEGVSLLPLWSGRSSAAHPPGTVFIDEHRDEAYVRDGRWKAVFISDTPVNAYDGADPGNADYLAALRAGDTAKAAAIRAQHPSVWKLYDLEADRGETTDLAAKRPEVLKRLVEVFGRYMEQHAPL